MREIIRLKRDESQMAILRAMGSKVPSVTFPAQEIFAAVAGQLISQVLDQAATHRLIYGEPRQYNIDDGNPEMPLELLQDIQEGAMTIWSQARPGGLATNEVTGPLDEFRVRTYMQESAVSMSRCFARKARVDVLSAVLNRVLQEILVKSEVQAWLPILAALGESRVDGNLNLINSTLVGKLSWHDVNALWTKVARVRQSWVGGTPVGVPCEGLTHLFVSPEMLQSIRAWAYNPANTEGVPDSDESTAMPLPDTMRLDIFRNGGLPEMFGAKIVSLNELGVGKAWTLLFDKHYTAGGGDPAFTVSEDEIVVGVDVSCPAFYHFVGVDECENTALQFYVDDQFKARDEKFGFYTQIRQGFSVMDAKAVTGVVIQGS